MNIREQMSIHNLILLYKICISSKMHKDSGCKDTNSQKITTFTFGMYFVDGNPLLHSAFRDKAFLASGD